MDREMEIREAQARARTERAKRDREEIEREAMQRAEELERQGAVDRRAAELIREREAAFETASAMPRSGFVPMSVEETAHPPEEKRTALDDDFSDYFAQEAAGVAEEGVYAPLITQEPELIDA
jgi:hypothetical protein